MVNYIGRKIRKKKEKKKVYRMIQKIFLGIWKFIKSKRKKLKMEVKTERGIVRREGDRERKVEGKEKSCKGDRVHVEQIGSKNSTD